jgi:hypothetical protein
MEKRTDTSNDVSYYGGTREYTSPTNIGIVLNHYFGGFDISQWAREQYRDRALEGGYIPTPIRTDERLIEMLLTHGSKKVSGPLSSLGVEYILYDYYVNNCYTIDEYDGGERLTLKHDKYKVVKMTQLIYNVGISDKERMEQLKIFLNTTN